MLKPRFLTLCAIVLACALSRLIPHPWNVSPVAAAALFAGAHFSQKRWAYFIPLASLMVSDLILGFYPGISFIYAAMAFTVFIGWSIRGNKTFASVTLASLGSSFLFYLITNFGVWAFGQIYPHTFSGLLMCYFAAIPFFQNTLLGDLGFTALLFGALYAADKKLAWEISSPSETYL
jgi:hypothetical protein